MNLAKVGGNGDFGIVGQVQRQDLNIFATTLSYRSTGSKTTVEPRADNPRRLLADSIEIKS